MATRSRTKVFLQYRGSVVRTNPTNNNAVLSTNNIHQSNETKNPKKTSFSTVNTNKYKKLNESEAATLLEDNNAFTVIELDNLSPQWIKKYNEVSSEIDSIKETLLRLEDLYKRNLLPGFTDNSQHENSIEIVSSEITRKFNSCEFSIANLMNLTKDANVDPRILKNVQRSLAVQLQDQSTEFRNVQKNYVKKLQGKNNAMRTSSSPLQNDKRYFNNVSISKDSSPASSNYQDQQLLMTVSAQQNQDIENRIAEREKEIYEISKSINEVAGVFKHLQTLVIDQGTVLDRIDYNIENVAISAKDTVAELTKGEEYQIAAGKKKLMLLLILMILVLFVIVLFKT